MKLSKRTIASRANGARSQGPKTEAGKLRSSINAMRHGLLSQCVVLQSEPAENFKALFQQHIDKFCPVDDVELACIEEMAAATWRIRRLMAIETNLLDQAVEKRTEEAGMGRVSGAFSQLSAGPELALIDRYESRLHRTYQRSLHNLMLMRQFEDPLEPGQPDADPAATPDPATGVPAATGQDLEEPPQPNEPTEPQVPVQSKPCDAVDTQAPAHPAGVPVTPPPPTSSRNPDFPFQTSSGIIDS